jgi:REP element-mobilizing transposase RayT
MERYRISADGGLYFITMTVVDWLPVFVAEAPCKIVTESLNFCHERKELRINAYVIMPTHIHAIVFGRTFDPAALERTLIDFRKFTGRRLADFCTEHMPRSFTEVMAGASGGDRAHRFWQGTFHPVQIESEAFWDQKRDYLHDNPCRKGLVVRADHWRFSSAAYWVSDGQAASDVLLSAMDW